MYLQSSISSNSVSAPGDSEFNAIQRESYNFLAVIPIMLDVKQRSHLAEYCSLIVKVKV